MKPTHILAAYTKTILINYKERDALLDICEAVLHQLQETSRNETLGNLISTIPHRELLKKLTKELSDEHR